MSYFDDHKKVVKAIMWAIKQVSEFNEEEMGFVGYFVPNEGENYEPLGNVIYGSRSEDIHYPQCWILPAPEAINNNTFRGQEHLPRFDIVVVIEDSDPANGQWVADELGCKIYDSIMSDRTLKGVITDLSFTGRSPLPADIEDKSKDKFGNILNLECRYFRYA